jgi:hypothetical protein
VVGLGWSGRRSLNELYPTRESPMRLVVLVVACLGLLANASAKSSIPTGELVVIRASFVRGGNPCLVPKVDPSEDGIGAWYVGAPCQRASQNPLNPSCWEQDEDPCLVFTDGGTLEENGSCPDQPCQLEYVFTVSFDEPCVAPCDQVKCCKAGYVRFTDGYQVVGTVWEGSSTVVSEIDSCDCTELEDHKCTLVLHAECNEFGPYYYGLTTFGYDWSCKKCN